MKIHHHLFILCAVISISLSSCKSSVQDSEIQDPGTTTEVGNNEAVAGPSDAIFDVQQSYAKKSNDPMTPSIKKHICSEYGFAWESINLKADIYTVILFNDTEFIIGAYTMNGSSNPKEFTRQFDFPGSWVMIHESKVEGTFYNTGKKVEWTFNQDYTTLKNNNDVEFNKVKISN